MAFPPCWFCLSHHFLPAGQRRFSSSSSRTALSYLLVSLSLAMGTSSFQPTFWCWLKASWTFSRSGGVMLVALYSALIDAHTCLMVCHSQGQAWSAWPSATGQEPRVHPSEECNWDCSKQYAFKQLEYQEAAQQKMEDRGENCTHPA